MQCRLHPRGLGHTQVETLTNHTNFNEALVLLGNACDHAGRLAYPPFKKKIARNPK